ncbi:MAG: hypothetical protein WBA16_08430 [Nonlabens sp.]
MFGALFALSQMMRTTLQLLLLLVATSLNAQISEDGWDSAFAKAEQAYQSKDWNKARELYKPLLQSSSTDTLLIHRMGNIAGYQSDFELAASYFKLLVNDYPNNADYHYKYGAALGLRAKQVSKLTALGLLDDVKKHLKLAATLNKEHIETRHALSQMYCELPAIVGGSYAVATRYARELLAISPIDGYLAMGFVTEYQENYQDADSWYQKAIAVGNSPTSYHKLIKLYAYKMDRLVEARQLVMEAIKNNPTDSSLAELKKQLF